MTDSQEDREVERERDEEAFELDLDGDDGSLDDVMREAVEAVDRHRPGREPAAPEGAERPGSAAPAAEPDTGAGAAPQAETADGGGEEVRRLRDQLVRTLADFDNFRKRSDREKADLRRFALFEALRDFLGVLDNLERAVGAAGSAEDLRQGVRMIVRQLEEVFRRYGVQSVEAAGSAFDPTMHEAVGRVESEEVDQPTVAEVLQKGYRLHDRLLRPALVNVAVPAGGVRPGAAPPAGGADVEGEAAAVGDGRDGESAGEAAD